MEKLELLSCFIMLLFSLVHGQGFSFLDYDGVQRVVTLNEQNFNETIQKNNLVVALFTIPDSNKQLHEQHSHFLEMTAQIMEKRQVIVGMVDMAENVQLSLSQGVRFAGTIHVYKNSRKTVFNGHRSPEVLINFLFKLKDNPVIAITGKADKKAFDNIDSLKVLGFFELQNSPEYLAFEEAARRFQPSIPFYVVFDKKENAKVAKHLKLKTPNSVYLLKPYDKQMHVCPQIVTTYLDVESCVIAGQHTVLRKLEVDDIHSLWAYIQERQWQVEPQSDPFLLTFLKPQTPEGAHFFKLLKKLVRTNINNTQLHIIWIDPTPFPTMLDYWQATFGIDVNAPAIGLVNLTSNIGVWFNMTLLNTTEDRAADTANLKLFQQWVEEILAGNITLNAAMEQEFLRSQSSSTESQEPRFNPVSKEAINPDQVGHQSKEEL